MRKLTTSVLLAGLAAWGVAQQAGGDAAQGSAGADEITVDVLHAETLEEDLGDATLRDAEGGGLVVRLQIDANDRIAPGEHAIHLHETGDCGPADADGDGTPEPAGAAGGHFDPTDVGHGEDDGPHVGDSEAYNYAFGEDGSFSGEVRFPLASLNGENAILDGDGAALVIHEGVDDMETNPSGRSGPRLACAAVTAEAGG